jgi:hypothetical protein
MKEYFALKNKEHEKQKEDIKNAKSFDELQDIKYGAMGSPKRDKYEEKANYFCDLSNAQRSPQGSEYHTGRTA